ncbi:hypothetical protein QJS10_CPA08g00797 [Acorus calamus]|uniref:Uncharacterized protein n=1 Tax=Acorus calamus TaxID=4465 RepID=A0AAV9EEC9_ACOCL|nr:hypothetical protein QJS10_CPA08g00797 [Acorus calamus]
MVGGNVKTTARGRARSNQKIGLPMERRDSSWCPRVDVGFGFSVVVRLPPPPSCGCPRAVVRRFRPKRGSKIRPERNRAPWSPVAPGALLPYQGLAGPIPEGQGLSSPLPEKGVSHPGFSRVGCLPPEPSLETVPSPAVGTGISLLPFQGFRASAFRERIALGRPFPETRDLVGEHVPVETLVSRDQPRRGTRYGPPCCVSHPGFHRGGRAFRGPKWVSDVSGGFRFVPGYASRPWAISWESDAFHPSRR